MDERTGGGPGDDPALDAALGALERTAARPSGFCEPFVELFPISGASVSTLGDLLGSETVSASDDVAARLDEIQFDLGEGPCWDAMNLAHPVLEPHFRAREGRRWPAFSAALLEHEVVSLFAFPVVVGPLRIGAVDLYSDRAIEFGHVESRRAGTMADAVGRHLLRHALGAMEREYEEVGNAFSRRLIHQATGMVIAQLRISAEDAQLIIQGRAFATGESMMSVAQQITEARLAFVRGEHGIEVAG